MKARRKFNEWMYTLSERLNYDQRVDGPPLHPNTISGAEVQIRYLASEIFTTFCVDPQFQQYREQIMQARSLMEQAADALGQGMAPELRSATHSYANQ